MTDYQKSMFERAEQDWLREPDDIDPDDIVHHKCCEECGGMPEGDMLYLANGKWCCEECALESLEKMYIND